MKLIKTLLLSLAFCGVLGQGNVINSYTFYDPDYKTLLDYYLTNGLTLPSDAKKAKENAFMIAFKSAFTVSSISSAPVAQMLMFKTDASSAASLVNWANPGTRNATNNGATFTSDLGWNGNGSSTYIISGLTLANITQSNFSIATRAYSNSQINAVHITGAGDAGATSAESLTLNVRNTSDQINYRALGGATAITVTSIFSATNRIVFGRTDASNVHISVNGAAFSSSSSTADAAESTSLDIFILAYNQNGTAANFDSRGVSYRIVFTRKLTDAEVAAVDAALANYLN